MTKSDTLVHIFGPNGLLDAHLTGYESRPQQLKMALSVWRAFQGDKRAVVEAATGTGKTLAYLIPALLSGKQVIVSTATKALQSQIVDKDIPLLEKIFEKTPTKVKAVLLKGRTNYLCKFRYEAIRHTITFGKTSEVSDWSKITHWAPKTKDGDRGKIPGLPDNYPPWAHISATGAQCHGNRCEHYEDCFVTLQRREARDANLIIVNHHLFFADLALKRSGVSSLLPEYDAIIFDEAHHLEQIATNFFGNHVSNFRLVELVADIKRSLIEEDALTMAGRSRLLGVETATEGFFSVFKEACPEGRYSLADIFSGKRTIKKKPIKETVDLRCEILTDELEMLAGWLEIALAGSITEKLVERTRNMISELVSVTALDQTGSCYIFERRGRGIFLEASPIHIGPQFRSSVLEKEGAQIYTSATLATEQGFDFFMERLGMQGRDDVLTAKLGSVFDYASNARLYVPHRLPAPEKENWMSGMCQIIKYLVDLTEGRAFVLFTSYKNMELAFEALEDELDYPIFKQGDAPKGELLELFRKETHSVLFATSSFWEGVDVKGESLSLVIIDKLPFANPSDPLTQARMHHIEANGGHPFGQYQIPTAIIALKQGFGRLIRSRDDRGVVAILDSRLNSRQYGKKFLKALPPAPIMWNAWEVRDWWQSISEQED